MLKLSHRDMVDAMRRNDARYDGKFWVGVHSTGIYCLPSCPARTPLVKNVVFYPTRAAAAAARLRPCKRCRPDRFPQMRPEWLDGVLEYMRRHPAERLNEARLVDMAGVDISTIRRYFRQHHHTSPLAFHRRLRLQRARRLIESGTDYLSAAFESGYESASGFRDAFVREFGRPPGSYHVAR